MGKRGLDRGQVSLEFSIIIGFVTLLLIPLISVFYLQIRDSNNQIITQQAYNIAKEVVDKAEAVYYLGAPSKTMLKVYMPSNIERIDINNREVVFRIKFGSAISEVDVPSDVNLTGSIHKAEGTRYIHIESMGSYVSIQG